MPQMNVKYLTTAEECQKVYQFRYRVQSLHFDEARSDVYHESQQIKDELDEKSDHYVVVKDGEIIACLRLTLMSKANAQEIFLDSPSLVSFIDQQSFSKISYTSRFMLDPSYRGHTVVSLLFCAVFSQAFKQNVDMNVALIKPEMNLLYQRLGYRNLIESSVCSLSRLTPMILHLKDRSHFRHVMSPFYDLFPSEFSEEITDEDLMQSIESVNISTSLQMLPLHLFWALLADAHARLYANRPSLKDGLNEMDWAFLMRQSQTYFYHEGELVDFDQREILCAIVLKGKIAKQRLSKVQKNWVEMYAPGDTLSPIEFRGDDDLFNFYMAIEDTRLLLVGHEAIKAIRQVDPILATKLSMNLITLMEKHRQSELLNEDVDMFSVL